MAAECGVSLHLKDPTRVRLCACAVCFCPCRWGYPDVETLDTVVANYTQANIPLECLWLDIEHQGNRFKTLTFDSGGLLCCTALLPEREAPLWGMFVSLFTDEVLGGQ